MTTAPDAPDIIDAEGRSRFEMRTDDQLAGYLDYERGEGQVDYRHTFVSERFRHHGLGGVLVRAALDDARHRRLKVKPTCDFVARWIDQHPGYQDLVG